MLLPKEVELINALRLLTDDERAAHTKAIIEAARHNQAVVDQHLKRLAEADPSRVAKKRLP